MKKAVITGPKSFKIVDVPVPVPKEDWVLVKITTAPMCTEYKQYESGIVDLPLGHEAAGEVVEVDKPGKVKVGDRVVVMPQYPCGTCSLCRQGEYIHCENLYDFHEFTNSEHGSDTYAQYILKPSWLLPVIPESMTDEHASMLCCGLGPTFGAMERMNVKDSDTILITGLGPVGLGGIINGKFRGCKIIGITSNIYRANLAKALGADVVLDPEEPEIIKPY